MRIKDDRVRARLFAATAVVLLAGIGAGKAYDFARASEIRRAVASGLDPVWLEGPALDFSLPSLDGESPGGETGGTKAYGDPRSGQDAGLRTLSSYRGRVVLLNFWFTGCAPCRREMPALDRLARELGGLGLKVVTVSVDEEGQSAVERFFRETPAFQVRAPALERLIDPGRGRQTALVYGTSKYPESYLIDREGRLRYRFIGEREWDSPAALRFLRDELR